MSINYEKISEIVDNLGFVDMDDVMCDYMGMHSKMKLENPRMNYPQSSYGFFDSLEPIPGAIEGIKTLNNKYDIYLLTRPSIKNGFSYSGKWAWVKEHLGEEWLEKLIINPNKNIQIGRFLIDDMSWPGFIGEHIHFGQPKFPNWETVLNHLMK